MVRRPAGILVAQVSPAQRTQSQLIPNGTVGRVLPRAVQQGVPAPPGHVGRRGPCGVRGDKGTQVTGVRATWVATRVVKRTAGASMKMGRVMRVESDMINMI